MKIVGREHRWESSSSFAKLLNLRIGCYPYTLPAGSIGRQTLCCESSTSDEFFAISELSQHRSLDLITEIMENAGGTLLSAGGLMSPAEVLKCLVDYNVNVLTGDSSQVVQIVYYLSMAPPEERKRIKLNKIIYTSEALTGSQRSFIKMILGDTKICSVMGSAEAGPWAISNPDLTGEPCLTNSSTADFVIDTRDILIEILSPSVLDDDSSLDTTPLAEGEPGIIVQTSLQRLRNPLVRYITGDVGSLHPLPKFTKIILPEADREHLRVLRMHGRDRRFSLEWFGEYFEFDGITALMQTSESGILQWQVILDRLDSSPMSILEVRLLRSPPFKGILSDEDLLTRLQTFFYIRPENESLCRFIFLDDVRGFELSATGGKVIKFVDRWHEKTSLNAKSEA